MSSHFPVTKEAFPDGFIIVQDGHPLRHAFVLDFLIGGPPRVKMFGKQVLSEKKVKTLLI